MKVRKGRKFWGRLIPVGVLFGEGKRLRFNRWLYLEDSEDGYTFRIPNPHPRRALILLDGIKTPVRIKGKR